MQTSLVYGFNFLSYHIIIGIHSNLLRSCRFNLHNFKFKCKNWKPESSTLDPCNCSLRRGTETRINSNNISSLRLSRVNSLQTLTRNHISRAKLIDTMLITFNMTVKAVNSLASKCKKYFAKLVCLVHQHPDLSTSFHTLVLLFSVTSSDN